MLNTKATAPVFEDKIQKTIHVSNTIKKIEVIRQGRRRIERGLRPRGNTAFDKGAFLGRSTRCKHSHDDHRRALLEGGNALLRACRAAQGRSRLPHSLAMCY